MSQNYTMHHKVLITITVILFIAVPILKVYDYITLSVNFLFMSNLMAFIFILDYKAERFMKGVALILFGIFAGIVIPEQIFPEFVSGVKPTDALGLDVYQKLDIFKNLMIFACSGAGGSILANHADKSATDREDVVVQQTVIDKTELINNLSQQVVSLNKKLSYLFSLVLFIFVVTLVLIAI